MKPGTGEDKMKVLILVGSPKGKKSASENFATYLEDTFKINGASAEKDYIVKHQRSEKLTKLAERAQLADLLVMVNPLYIDSIPAITINFMEEYCTGRNNQAEEQLEPQKLLVLFNSGFPEPHHNNLAVKMCEIFAEQSQMEWVGGVTIGMGAAFENQPVADAGPMSRTLRKGLDEMVYNLTHNQPVNPEAIITASKPLLPLTLSKWGMRLMGGRMWKKKVQDKKIVKQMYQRPYEM